MQTEVMETYQTTDESFYFKTLSKQNVINFGTYFHNTNSLVILNETQFKIYIYFIIYLLPLSTNK